MKQETTGNWEKEFDRKYKDCEFGEFETDTQAIKSFIHHQLQKAREEAIVAIFSGATIEYKGRFFKISDQDALNFIQWRQANLTNSQE